MQDCMFRGRKTNLVFLVLAVVSVGFGAGFLQANVVVVQASVRVYAVSNVVLSNWSGLSCIPVTRTIAAVIPGDAYDQLLNMSSRERDSIMNLANLCEEALIICHYQPYFGGECDPSQIYPPPYGTPLPISVRLVGYVLDASLSLDNSLPMRIENVTASDNKTQLRTNVASSNCNTRSSLTANVTMGPLDRPTNILLVVHADVPITWFMLGNFGTIHRDLRVVLQFIPANMTVREIQS